MNAGGVPNTCKSSGLFFMGQTSLEVRSRRKDSGEWVSNAWAIYLEDWDNSLKEELIPDNFTSRMGSKERFPLGFCIERSPRPIS